MKFSGNYVCPSDRGQVGFLWGFKPGWDGSMPIGVLDWLTCASLP